MTSTETRQSQGYWHSDTPGELSIPVAKPRLPTASEITPYLHRIDQSQWYSNNGPLVQEFEERLAEQFGGGTTRVATVANATIGLTLALIAQELPRESLCMVPAWTFAATGHAIALAGLTPWVVDVDPASWALEPPAAHELLPRAPGKVSAIVPVSPFGAPVDYEGWEAFRDVTGVAVVIDAAAAFDTVRATSVPAVVSLHATKVFGVGEGGVILTRQADFAQEIQKRSNFGFWYSRESKVQSLNGKLSEYTAAVGLAALDSLPKIRGDLERVARAYQAGLSKQETKLQPGLGQSWIASTIVAQTPNDAADAVGDALTKRGIGSRRWWGGGLHRHRAFANCPRHETRQAEQLADSTIGLPCWRDLPNDTIADICAVVRSVCG
jgi:dTDP-4-amino-4,6-dideoxygalactose transaminase